jgi:hypothetical protein
MSARDRLWILFCLLLATPAGLVAADQPASTDRTETEPAVRSVESSPSPFSLVELSEEQLARLTPLQLALREVLLTEQAELAPLYAAFARETDSLRGLEIQRQIQTIKQNTELALLRTQADFARREGRVEVAKRIEESLRLMTEPAPSEPQTPRPQR